VSNEFNYEYEGLPLTIVYDYSPAERMTYDDPGCAADVDITEVLCHDVDIYPILLPTFLEDLQERTLIHAEESIYEAKIEAAIDYYEARKEDRYLEGQNL